jgi:hypothetical protein
MEMTLTTPALIFPAVTLLLLAYSNRFLGTAKLVRTLHQQYEDNPNSVLKGQIINLRKRLAVIRDMQALGVFSLLLAMLSMFCLFAKLYLIGNIIFAVSLLTMIGSLVFSLYEIQISVVALNLQLAEMEDD